MHGSFFGADLFKILPRRLFLIILLTPSEREGGTFSGGTGLSSIETQQSQGGHQPKSQNPQLQSHYQMNACKDQEAGQKTAPPLRQQHFRLKTHHSKGEHHQGPLATH